MVLERFLHGIERWLNRLVLARDVADTVAGSDEPGAAAEPPSILRRLIDAGLYVLMSLLGFLTEQVQAWAPLSYVVLFLLAVILVPPAARRIAGFAHRLLFRKARGPDDKASKPPPASVSEPPRVSLSDRTDELELLKRYMAHMGYAQRSVARLFLLRDLSRRVPEIPEGGQDEDGKADFISAMQNFVQSAQRKLVGYRFSRSERLSVIADGAAEQRGYMFESEQHEAGLDSASLFAKKRYQEAIAKRQAACEFLNQLERELIDEQESNLHRLLEIHDETERRTKGREA